MLSPSSPYLQQMYKFTQKLSLRKLRNLSTIPLLENIKISRFLLEILDTHSLKMVCSLVERLHLPISKAARVGKSLKWIRKRSIVRPTRPRVVKTAQSDRTLERAASALDNRMSMQPLPKVTLRYAREIEKLYQYAYRGCNRAGIVVFSTPCGCSLCNPSGHVAATIAFFDRNMGINSTVDNIGATREQVA